MRRRVMQYVLMVRWQLLALLQIVLLNALPIMAFTGSTPVYAESGTAPGAIQHFHHFHRYHNLLQVPLMATTTDCNAVPCLALTFDDGPNPMTTPQVLADLEQAHVPATFFVIGSRIGGQEALLRQMHADGDEIGNHSWTHPNLTTLPVDQIHEQIDQTQAAVAAAGVPAPTMLRPPFGAVNQAVIDNANMSILLWNEDPKDWAANTPQQVIASVEASAKAGGIIDMHDIYHVTANALPQVVTDLQARGFHFVTVSQLLNLTPSSRGIYYGHP